MLKRPLAPSAESPAPLAAPPVASQRGASGFDHRGAGALALEVPDTIAELSAVPLVEEQVFQGSGGVVQPGAFYIPRAIDDALPALLRSGAPCYVLGPRQSGKSSLRLRAQEALRAQGLVCATLDLSAIGTPQSAEPWYYALCEHLAHQLGLPSPEPFYTREPLLPPGVRFQRYLRDQVLTHDALNVRHRSGAHPALPGEGAQRSAAPLIGAEPERMDAPSMRSGSAQKPAQVVLFIEEVDVTLTLPFPRADFFAALRALHDGRAEDPVLRRLTLCLLGATPPLGLSEDPARTFFAVARTLELADFNAAEARAFLGRLPRLPRGPQAWLDAVLYWTSGHPVLTQRLCEALSSGGPSSSPGSGAPAPEALFRAPGQSDLEVAVLRAAGEDKAEEAAERAHVAGLVQALFLGHGARGLAEVPVLGSIDRAFASVGEARALRMLGLYRRVIGTSVASAAPAGGAPSAATPTGAKHDPLWLRPGLLCGGRVAATRQDEAELALRATGLVTEAIDREARSAAGAGDEGACLVVRNRVFALIFDEAWAQRRLASRPLAAALRRWREAGRGDAGLLQGEELATALTWADGRADVDPDERDLLLRSLVAARAADKAQAEAQAVARALQVKEDRAQLKQRQRSLVQVLAGAILGLLLVMIGLAVDAARSRGARALAEVARLREAQRRAARERDLAAEQAAHEKTRSSLAQTQVEQQAARRDTDEARAALGRLEVRAKDVEGKMVGVFKKRLPQRPGVWVDTDVDADPVDRVMLQKGWPALRRCYPAAPLLPAPLRAELTVLPDGAVEKAVVDGPADARACAAAALLPLRFPRFAGSSFVRISYVLRAHGR